MDRSEMALNTPLPQVPLEGTSDMHNDFSPTPRRPVILTHSWSRLAILLSMFYSWVSAEQACSPNKKFKLGTSCVSICPRNTLLLDNVCTYDPLCMKTQILNSTALCELCSSGIAFPLSGQCVVPPKIGIILEPFNLRGGNLQMLDYFYFKTNFLVAGVETPLISLLDNYILEWKVEEVPNNLADPSQFYRFLLTKAFITNVLGQDIPNLIAPSTIRIKNDFLDDFKNVTLIFTLTVIDTTMSIVSEKQFMFQSPYASFAAQLSSTKIRTLEPVTIQLDKVFVKTGGGSIKLLVYQDTPLNVPDTGVSYPYTDYTRQQRQSRFV